MHITLNINKFKTDENEPARECPETGLKNSIYKRLDYRTKFRACSKRAPLCHALWKTNSLTPVHSLLDSGYPSVWQTETWALKPGQLPGYAMRQQRYNDTSAIRGPATMKAGRWNSYRSVRCRRWRDIKFMKQYVEYRKKNLVIATQIRIKGFALR